MNPPNLVNDGHLWVCAANNGPLVFECGNCGVSQSYHYSNPKPCPKAGEWTIRIQREYEEKRERSEYEALQVAKARDKYLEEKYGKKQLCPICNYRELAPNCSCCQVCMPRVESQKTKQITDLETERDALKEKLRWYQSFCESIISLEPHIDNTPKPTIEALLDKVKELISARNRIKEVESQLTEACELLKPFGDYASRLVGWKGDTSLNVAKRLPDGSIGAEPKFTLGYCRKIEKFLDEVVK